MASHSRITRVSSTGAKCALAASALLLGLAVPQSGGALAQSCTTISSQTVCGGRSASNTVGRTVIFNQGPAGQRIGDLTIIEKNGRPRVFRDVSPSKSLAAMLDRMRKKTAGPTGRLARSGKGPVFANQVPRRPKPLGTSRSRFKR